VRTHARERRSPDLGKPPGLDRRGGIPVADICCLLRDEHFGDELHPNDRGAKIIAEAVFHLLPKE